MKHKMGVKTRQKKKYKVRLNIDGSMMVHQKHHEQTYAPVATCNSIRTLLIQDLLNKWKWKRLDYVLVLPQDLVERDAYMNIPQLFEIK